VEANGLEVLYDAQQDKAATAALGTLAAGAKTGAAVKAVKLLAQSTGDLTRDELKKDAKLAWTDKTKAEIAAAKGENGSNGSSSSNGTTDSTDGTDNGGSNGGQNNGGTGTVTPSGGGDPSTGSGQGDGGGTSGGSTGEN